MVGAITEKKREALAENRERAKRIRHEPFDTEKLFWSEVRSHKLGGFKFKRQVLIGSYIVDFVCLERKLIVELDGPQHAHRVAYDEARDSYLQKAGYRVLRFANTDVSGDLGTVLAIVLRSLKGVDTPSP